MMTFDIPASALLFHDVIADGAILMQQPAILAACSKPTAIPGSVDP